MNLYYLKILSGEKSAAPKRIYALNQEITAICQNADFYYHLKESNKIFWNMLAYYLPQTGRLPAKVKNILNLGCGKAVELPVLDSFFSGNQEIIPGSNKITIYNLDRSARRISKLIKNNKSNKRIFMAKDIQEFPAIKSLPAKYEVILLRHPLLKEQDTNWEELIKSALQALSRDGVLIITNYLQEEWPKIKAISKKINNYISYYYENKFSKILFAEEAADPDPTKQDGYLTIIRPEYL